MLLHDEMLDLITWKSWVDELATGGDGGTLLRGFSFGSCSRSCSLLITDGTVSLEYLALFSFNLLS